MASRTGQLVMRLIMGVTVLALAALAVLYGLQSRQLAYSRQELEAVNRRLEAMRLERPGPLLGLRESERRRLQRQGLSEPETDLLLDLAERPELIPHEGVHGGVMRFVPEESVVLNARWVWAAYEDGHIRGTLLAEFRIDEQGEIEWEVLRAALD